MNLEDESVKPHSRKCENCERLFVTKKESQWKCQDCDRKKPKEVVDIYSERIPRSKHSGLSLAGCR